MIQAINTPSPPDRQFWQALRVWGLFLVLAVVLNGTIPFLLGIDLRPWTYSPVKALAFGFVIYSGVFMVVPLILTKGWRMVSLPPFLIPLLVAVVGITLWGVIPAAVVSGVLVLTYLHWRYDLSALGFRSHGWRGDVIAVVLIAVLGIVQVLMRSNQNTFALDQGIMAGLNRWFTNPASTVENLFYFGFLTERLSVKLGRTTPLVVGGMYTLHEMSNPEYWYQGQSFVVIFVGITLFTAVYLWRRSVVVVWLGDGLQRLVTRAF